MADKKPNCIKCGFVTVIDENIEFIQILEKYHILISNGMGGIQSDAIRMIMDIEDIDKEIFLNKLNIYYSNGLRAREHGSSTDNSSQQMDNFLEGTKKED